MTWHLIIFIAAFLTILLPAAEGCADTPADRGVEPGTSYNLNYSRSYSPCPEIL